MEPIKQMEINKFTCLLISYLTTRHTCRLEDITKHRLFEIAITSGYFEEYKSDSRDRDIFIPYSLVNALKLSTLIREIVIGPDSKIHGFINGKNTSVVYREWDNHQLIGFRNAFHKNEYVRDYVLSTVNELVKIYNISLLTKDKPRVINPSKLTMSKAIEIRAKYKQGVTVDVLSKSYNVNKSTIYRVLRNEMYKV